MPSIETTWNLVSEAETQKFFKETIEKYKFILDNSMKEINISEKEMYSKNSDVE